MVYLAIGKYCLSLSFCRLIIADYVMYYWFLSWCTVRRQFTTRKLLVEFGFISTKVCLQQRPQVQVK